MKLKFEKHKGARLYKQFMWIQNDLKLWWSHDDHKWIIDTTKGNCSTCCNCNSVRSFRKHLKRHPELRGHAILVSKYIGYSVRG